MQSSIINELFPNEDLRKRYKEYGLCKECKQPNTERNSCQSCLNRQEVDKLIQKSHKLFAENKEALE